MLALRALNLMLVWLCLVPAVVIAKDTAMSKQDQCADYGVYKDSNDNWIDCDQTMSQQKSQADVEYTEDEYIEQSYEDNYYVEEPYVEEPYVEETYTD